MFKLEIQAQLELFAEFPKTGDRDGILKILGWLNVNEPKREKFEMGYRNLSLLWETLHPDPFLIEFEPPYLWLGRIWIYYVKEFYPLAQKFETDPADGAKTRELIRQNVDVEDLKKNLPTYVLDADYLTKMKDRPPDSKALEIEALLAAELQIRVGEEEEFQPLSERLKRVVQQKRNGTLAGLALLKELEELAKETVALIQESQRPVAESFMKAARERSPALSTEDAGKIAVALIGKADEILFPGWIEQEHVDTELFRAFTTVLAKQFPAASLHTSDKDFVERCIKLLRRKNYRAQTND
jgi:type I restriction enzyme R subunit